MGLAFPKPRAAFFDKRDAARDKERAKRSAYAAVDARDQHRCRCCGKRATHKHHIRFRSKGGEDASANLVSLDAGCHALIHARQLWIVGSNADKRLVFEIHEAAVVDVFGTKSLPAHVRIVTDGRRTG